MTKREWDKLKEGDKVWVDMPYFAYKMLGVVKIIKHEKGIWLNFFGDGQMFWRPPRMEVRLKALERYKEEK